MRTEFLALAIMMVVSCAKVDYQSIDTLKRECVGLPDGSYYFMIHRPHCRHTQSIWKVRIPLDEFYKYADTAYCPFCFDDDDVKFLDAYANCSMRQLKLKYDRDQFATYEDGAMIRRFDFDSYGYGPRCVNKGGELVPFDGN